MNNFQCTIIFQFLIILVKKCNFSSFFSLLLIPLKRILTCWIKLFEPFLRVRNIKACLPMLRKLRIYITKEFLDFRHWSRNPKFYGKSWELYCYQASYWHFYGKPRQCGLLISVSKVQTHPQLVKALKINILFCL